MDKREPGRPWYTLSQYQDDFYPRKREFPDLTPGAWRAKQLGCTCSRLDNQNGYGSVYQTDFSDGVEFLVTPNCPLHDKREEPE